MGRLLSNAKYFWLCMVEVPWHPSRANAEERFNHWLYWLVGWIWTLAGLVLGAFAASSRVRFLALSDTPYQDWFVIGISAVAGFLVQVIGVFVVAVAAYPLFEWLNRPTMKGRVGAALFLLFALAVFLLPLAGVGYGLYLYFTKAAADQRTVTIAFVGGLLVKTFLIPLVKTLLTGAAFKVLMGWLRGGKKKGI